MFQTTRRRSVVAARSPRADRKCPLFSLVRRQVRPTADCSGARPEQELRLRICARTRSVEKLVAMPASSRAASSRVGASCPISGARALCGLAHGVQNQLLILRNRRAEHLSKNVMPRSISLSAACACFEYTSLLNIARKPD